jgi:very-short-patch-repair endonuclease
LSKLEDSLELSLKSAKITGFVREFRFHPVRKWRLDFAWVDLSIGVEVEGGIWLPKSGHNTGVGITRDIDKGNALVLLGWKVLRVTEKMIKTGQAIDLIEAVLEE